MNQITKMILRRYMICNDCPLNETCDASSEEREATIFCMEKLDAIKSGKNETNFNDYVKEQMKDREFQEEYNKILKEEEDKNE